MSDSIESEKPLPLTTEQRIAEIRERLDRIATLGNWGVMLDGPEGDGKPWKAYKEAAAGLTIGASNHTEPIARVSGYLMSPEANAAFIANAPADLRFVLDELESRRALSREREDRRDDANLLRQLALDEDCRQRAAELYIPNEIPGILYRIASELDPEGDVLEIPTKRQILQFIRRRDAARSTPAEKAP